MLWGLGLSQGNPKYLHTGEAFLPSAQNADLGGLPGGEASTKASFGFAEVRLLLLVSRGPQARAGPHSVHLE